MKSVIFAYVTFAILTAVVFINSYAVSSYLSKIEDKLSEEILLGKIRNGQHVMVDCINGSLVFRA